MTRLGAAVILRFIVLAACDSARRSLVSARLSICRTRSFEIPSLSPSVSSVTRFSVEPPLLNDAQLALGQDRQRILEPAGAPVGVERSLDHFIRQRRVVDEEIHALRGARGFVVDELRVERNVRAGEPRVHHLDVGAGDADASVRSSRRRRRLANAPGSRARRARSRRRLKNSAFCVELVPPRTIDQLRST